MSLDALFLARGLRTWIGARLLVSLMMAIAGAFDPRAPLALTPGAALLLVGASVALGALDVARRGERALIGNFGIGRVRMLAWFAVPAAGGEIAVAMLHAMLHAAR